ncbi:Zinc finger MYND domain-containing protein 12 [Saguinus oedipus]|uniref:Zinc finger MYND domain-containing protein 12 n=1 Tax=Saguinus oedipus TaxID=9490 RepID=A0ABQ9VB28_SAGOE|nr:Zinc finger MYND domain-containing protein 12 [Saguinus oedipus]
MPGFRVSLPGNEDKEGGNIVQEGVRTQLPPAVPLEQGDIHSAFYANGPSGAQKTKLVVLFEAPQHGGVVHQKADWDSIHEKICQLLIPLRTSMPFYNSEEERQHGLQQLQQRQKYLIEFCYTVAQKYLFEGKHEDAVPAALHSLRFRVNLYGLSSVELVPAYLLLAEASLGE